MQTYQYYIDDIQSAVCAPETAEPDFLRDAAAQYAEACAEANQRLRQVGQLLRRGLRSEAIQLTEEEPNLLDFVGMLDFPELPAWRDMLKHWGMAPPPALLIDLASDINQAYADNQPLESLLKQNRLLALARAPLSGRIRTLRHIRCADSGNVAWEEDLKILESARIKQMDREMDAVFRRDDLTALAAIKGEVDSDDWLVSKPTSLRTKANRLYKDLSAKLARIDLEALEPALNAAHMAFDTAKGFQLRGRWNEAAETAELRPDDPLAERAMPALEWLAADDRRQIERDKRQRAMALLENALDENTPADKLGRLLEAALLYDEPIPPALRHRVEQRLAANALATKRRHRIILTSIAASVLLVGCLIGYVIVEQSRRASVAAVVSSLKTLIDQGRLNEAQEYYDKAAATPDLVASTDVQAQKAQLDEALSAERIRQDRFADAIKRARGATPDNPDLAALAEARQFAKTTEEKQSIADIESKIAAAVRETQGEHDAAISETLAGYRTRLKSIETSDRGDAERTIAALSELSRDIDGSKAKYTKANPAVLAQLDPLVARITVIRRSIDEQKQQAQARSAISSSVGNFTTFRAALEDFANRFPSSEIGGNIELLKQESKFWEGFAAWSDFVNAVASESNAYDTKKIREIIARGDQLRKDHANIQLSEYFDARKAYLESITTREPDGSPPLTAELQKLFRDPLVGNLWLIEVKRNDEARYYSRQEPRRESGSVRFDYLAGFDLEEKPQNVRESDASYVGRSPQSEIAERALDLISSLRPRDWEKDFTSILKQISDEQRLDPILKIALLQRVLKVAASGSSALADGFSQYRSELDNATLDLSVSWMNPRDETAQAERKRAEVFLGGLPPMVDSIRATAENLRRIRQPLDFKYDWVGWLDRDATGTWRIVANELNTETGDLLVLAKLPGQSVAEPAMIGVVEIGEVKLRNGATGALFAGRPVFIRVSRVKAK